MTNNAIDSNIPIEITKGGTGRSSLTAHSVLVGNGTSGITQLAVGATNTILNGNTGADPSFGALPVAAITNGSNGQTLIGGGAATAYNTLTAGSGISITNGANSITIAATGFGAPTQVFSAYRATDITNAVGQYTNEYTIVFDSEQFDLAGEYDTSTGIFTASQTGAYQFIANVTISYPTAQTNVTWFRAYFVTSLGKFSLWATSGSPATDAGVIGWTGYLHASLAAGDTVYVTVSVEDRSGSNSTTIVGQATNNYYTYFMGARL